LINIKQIETFVWVARLGSFAAAAERLCSTPSAVSLRMHELEDGLGVQLFDRSHRSVQLTAKGQELIGLADELLQVVWKIESTVGDSQAVTNLVRMGVGDLIAITWLSDLVSRMRQTYPRVTLELEIGLTKDLLEQLRNREADLILAPDASDSEFGTVSVGAVEFKWVAATQLGIPDQVLTPQKLAGWPIITLCQQSYHHKTVNSWFKTDKTPRRRAVVCNTISMLLSLVKSGLGVGLMAVSCIDEELKNGSLQVFESDPPIAPVEFFAMFPVDGCAPVVQRIAQLAADVSTFRKSTD
jgi:DNA-binding transcriptional LysR family regulator